MRSTRAAALALLAAVTVAMSTACHAEEAGASRAVTLPPLHAGLDYQLAAPYEPAAGVGVVTRDHTASPAAGLYNVCYVNAFQAQPGAEAQWDPDLLLRVDGEVVMDVEWDEAILDIGSDAKRERIAAVVGGWIDGCAAAGFQAVEADNLDSYTRTDGALTADDAQALARLLADRAHAAGLAFGQKNTLELAGDRVANGFDFAVAEECGQFDECGGYADAFADRVLVVEYTDEGMAAACADWGDRLSIVERDLDVSTPDDPGYVRATC